MNTEACLKMFCCSAFVVALHGYAVPIPRVYTSARSALVAKPRQSIDSENLAGSRWDGTINWTEKNRVNGRVVELPYSTKVTFKFATDGACDNGKGQPCEWEKKGQTVTITLARTKSSCNGSASLTLDGNMMSGSFDHYAGSTCSFLSRPRNIKLTRHEYENGSYKLNLDRSEVVAGKDSYVLTIQGLADRAVNIHYSLNGGPVEMFLVNLDSRGQARFDVPADARKGKYEFLGFNFPGNSRTYSMKSTILVR